LAQWTDKIAGVSFTTILLVLFLVTVLRGSLLLSRSPIARTMAELLDSVLLAITLVFLILRPLVVQSFYIPSGSMHPTLWEGDHILVNKWSYRFKAPQHGDIIVFRAPASAAPDEKDFIKRLVGLPGDIIEVREGYVVVGESPKERFFTRDALYSRLCPDLRSVDELLNGDGLQMPRLRLTTDAIWLDDRRISREEFADIVGRPKASVAIHPGHVVRNGEVLTESYVAEDPQYHMDRMQVPEGQLFVMGDNRNDSRDSHVWGTFTQDRVIGRADFVFWPLSHAKRLR
jgi:signal peptidase I